jgi:hypothetical protein
MPAAIPFAIKAAPFAISAISGLLGRKKNKTPAATSYAPNPAYAQPLSQFGGSVLPMAQKGFQSAFDFYGKAAEGNPELTASGAADTGRQVQTLTDRAARTMPRGGAQASMVGQLPQQQMAAGLQRQIAAKTMGAEGLAGLAGTAGGLGSNIFGNLIGAEQGGQRLGIEQQRTDLLKTGQDRDWYGKMGGSIMDILTGITGGGGFKGVKVPGAPGGFGLPGGGLPQGQVPPWLMQKGSY